MGPSRAFFERLAVIVTSGSLVCVAIFVLYNTVQTSPENVELLGGVITTLTGTFAGYIGGRESAGHGPPNNAG